MNITLRNLERRARRLLRCRNLTELNRLKAEHDELTSRRVLVSQPNLDPRARNVVLNNIAKAVREQAACERSLRSIKYNLRELVLQLRMLDEEIALK